MKIHLSGHLNWYDGRNRAWVELSTGEAIPLPELLARLGIPRGEVAVALVNGEVVALEAAVLQDADVVELFPPSSGG